MSKANGGIYTYTGTVSNNGAFQDGTLTYPSGNTATGKFNSNQLQIGQDLVQEYNKIEKGIDCTLPTQEQFN